MKKNSPETLETAIEKAAHYCADAEHCRFDVARKLHQWQVQKEWYQPVMNHLVATGFIDERRFAGSFARGKFNQNKWGKNKIRFALKQKQINHQDIEEGLKEINDNDYLETAKKLADDKIRKLKTEPHHIKMIKVKNFLISKGFETDIITEITKQK
jgi:regulatory protein